MLETRLKSESLDSNLSVFMPCVEPSPGILWLWEGNFGGKSKSAGPTLNESTMQGGTTSLIFTTILIWTSLPALLIREDTGEQDVRRCVRKKASRLLRPANFKAHLAWPKTTTGRVFGHWVVTLPWQLRPQIVGTLKRIGHG
jgi:hypothetical protein